jgi:lipopolysaccharide/colanic/teichoic acid biosynthesis glycosyltransferase
MKKVLFVMVLSLLGGGCTYFPKEVWIGEEECLYIGCETGGPIFYPHERPGDKNTPGENYKL